MKLLVPAVQLALVFATALAAPPVMAQSGRNQSVLINGAGATFPAPLYMKWFQEYKRQNPAVEINYQSIGSGGGIKQLTNKTVDFGASDAPLNEKEAKAIGQEVVHFPTVLGAVAITYNLPELKTPVKLDGAVVADIFSGKIDVWNHPKIAALNPGVSLPKKSIVTVYRSDSSGTTAVFTGYLARAGRSWEEEVGSGKSIKWPTGLGGKGNEGVTGQVKNTSGSMAYVELSFAVAEKLPVAAIKNKSGHFVTPTIESVTEAAAGAAKAMPEDLRMAALEPEGAKAYPIAAFTYILAYKNMPAPKGAHFVSFLEWAMRDGQKMAPSLSYAPLPEKVIEKVRAKIKSIKVQ